jgi:hypothetical protein
MTAVQKAQLPVFFSWFPELLATKEGILTPAEKKKLERQQELLNFN